MGESQIALIVAAAAILVTAVALYRQGALPRAGLAAAIIATLGLAGFLVATL
jgi:hypothetical protein